MKKKKIPKYKTSVGYTLIELLIVISIIAVIASVIFVLLDPIERFRDTRNSRRQMDVNNIAEAIEMYRFDNQQEVPGVDATLRVIGNAGTGCDISCGDDTSTTEIAYHNTSETLNYYSLGTYTARNWFDASSVGNFSLLTVSAVLDCNGSCSGNVVVRIGNASSYADYTLTSASSVRTDGTTSDYSWYTNTFSINKSTLGNYFFVQLLLYSDSGTMRFMMDESGPAGPDSEFRSGSNGDGSQSGWNNDNGDYFIKIEISAETPSACLDLNSALSKYLGSLPVDPELGTAENTYYALKKLSPRGIKVISCNAEKGEIIEAVR